MDVCRLRAARIAAGVKSDDEGADEAFGGSNTSDSESEFIFVLGTAIGRDDKTGCFVSRTRRFSTGSLNTPVAWSQVRTDRVAGCEFSSSLDTRESGAKVSLTIVPLPGTKNGTSVRI